MDDLYLASLPSDIPGIIVKCKVHVIDTNLQFSNFYHFAKKQADCSHEFYEFTFIISLVLLSTYFCLFPIIIYLRTNLEQMNVSEHSF